METYRGGLKGYWKMRRPYELMDGTKRPRRKTSVVHFTGSKSQATKPPTSQRRLRIRVKPRLKLLRRAIFHPLWLLGKIRDWYVRMMLRLANSPAFGYGGGVGMGAGGTFSRPAMKEYDEKVLVEIYKSLVGQGHIVLPAEQDDVTPVW